MKEINIQDIDGFLLGHSEDIKAGTGCTVLLSKEGGSAGVSVKGGAPGTRETDLLEPTEMIEKVHAIVLAGGSAFGLDASSGVMEYLEECNVGFDVGVGKVPIVCSAVLFDLLCGDSKVRPNKEMGYKAAKNAESYKKNINGNIGCGTGATIGKMLGPEYAMKGGFGSYAVEIGDLKVGAIVGVNCVGDVTNPENGQIIGGAFNKEEKKFYNTQKFLFENYDKSIKAFKGNTTIGVVMSNAKFTKAENKRIASVSHNAFARTIKPAHTMFDGDTIFSISSGLIEADINLVAELSTYAMEKAVVNAINNAETAYGYISKKELSDN